jgi:hypothetical protein
VDKKAFVRVCGNKDGTYPRAGHNVIKESGRAKVGYYKMARHIKLPLGQKMRMMVERSC